MNDDDKTGISADNAIIFDIQRFSLHDGPGIRTTIFFKGCPLSCAWCQNPESHKDKPELAFYKESCIRCFACREICRESAILDHPLSRINYQQCTACGQCATICDTNSLRLVGKKWKKQDLLKEILKDKDYFDDSGGGITLSGGEPFLCADFLTHWLPEVKDHKINITVETCGMTKWNRVEKLLPFLDLVFFDLKHMDTLIHKQYTGQGNSMILENFAKLSKTDKKIQARMPVIPGVNNTPENIKTTATFLRANNQRSIHLLPFHNLGEAKLGRLNTRKNRIPIPSITPNMLNQAKEQFKKEEIHAVLYD